jgi:cytochrome b561/polyisoprenoid-binding protein YceI
MTRIRYSTGAILLHWLIAAAFLFEIALGWRTEDVPETQSFALFQLHKSVGITILLLTLLRIGWRLINPPPPYPATLRPWERRLAHWVHIGFYVALIGFPLTGWLIVSSSTRTIPTMLYGVVPWPHVPGIATLADAAKHQVHEVAEFGHGAFEKIAYLLFALHVAGALKHHFVDRGDDLARMLPGARARFDWRLVLVLIGVVAAVAIGELMPLGGSAPLATAAPAVTPDPVAAPAPTVPAMAEPEAENAAVPQETAADAVEPSHWLLQKGASKVNFGTTWSYGTVKGSFGKWTADIVFDPEALDRSSVKVSIDMASVKTEDNDSNSALPGDDFFAVASHPIATFAARDFRQLGGDRYEARGTLKLRGVSRPLRLPFTLRIDGDAAHMQGSATIDRTAFGVGKGEWAATDSLPAEVKVNVAIEAKRK